MSTLFRKLNKFIKNPWKGYRYIRNSLSSSYIDNIEYIKEQNIVWHTCTPKSASSFWDIFCLAVLNKKKIKTNYFDAVPITHARQKLFLFTDHPGCSSYVRSQIAPFQELCFSSHQNVLASFYFLDMLSNKHTVVCQTRPILDTLVSLLDFYDAGHIVNPWSPVLHNFWNKLSFQEKINIIVDSYLPWHLHYLQTWILASDNYDVKFLFFDDVTGNPQKCLNEVLSRWDVTFEKKDTPIIETSVKGKDGEGFGPIKFNKGISGRGKSLIPEKTIERIITIVKKMDRLKQSLDDYI